MNPWMAFLIGVVVGMIGLGLFAIWYDRVKWKKTRRG